jgi:glutamate synthase domain-containing protein 3
VVDCSALTTREVNLAIRRLVAAGTADIRVTNPAARHNLAVALEGDTSIHFEGPAGWYVAGMNDGPHVTVRGNCG